MKPRHLQKDQFALSKYTKAWHPDQTEKFPQGVGRLYLAIVNRAILDVLENGKNSAAAERWLLSIDGTAADLEYSCKRIPCKVPEPRKGERK